MKLRARNSGSSTRRCAVVIAPATAAVEPKPASLTTTSFSASALARRVAEIQAARALPSADACSLLATAIGLAHASTVIVDNVRRKPLQIPPRIVPPYLLLVPSPPTTRTPTPTPGTVTSSAVSASQKRPRSPSSCASEPSAKRARIEPRVVVDDPFRLPPLEPTVVTGEPDVDDGGSLPSTVPQQGLSIPLPSPTTDAEPRFSSPSIAMADPFAEKSVMAVAPGPPVPFVEPLPIEPPLHVDSLPVKPPPMEPLAVKLSPLDPLPVGPMPLEPLPRNSFPVETLPVDPLPVDPLPVELPPVEPLPVEPLPVGPLRVDDLPVEPLPAEPLPVEPLPMTSLTRKPSPVEPLPRTTAAPLAHNSRGHSPPPPQQTGAPSSLYDPVQDALPVPPVPPAPLLLDLGYLPLPSLVPETATPLLPPPLPPTSDMYPPLMTPLQPPPLLPRLGAWSTTPATPGNASRRTSTGFDFGGMPLPPALTPQGRKSMFGSRRSGFGSMPGTPVQPPHLHFHQQQQHRGTAAVTPSAQQDELDQLAAKLALDADPYSGAACSPWQYTRRQP
ncbi:hypothetical protein BC828DRAFT_402316 [Blastocladiella britannica]|nr:hypothetical protein BC828DRAFT_402316 [Blastocladiella britannica]